MPPALADEITISPFEVNYSDLIETEAVQISRPRQNTGKYLSDTRGACMEKAVPTESGSMRYIQVFSGGKTFKYDCKQKESSEIRLKPGDELYSSR